jgi:hypothetical protein
MATTKGMTEEEKKRVRSANAKRAQVFSTAKKRRQKEARQA